MENFELREMMSFDSKVLSAKWNDEDGMWHFEIEQNGEIIHDTAHIFFNGSGFTTDWNWPDIRGIDSYKGKLIHAAQWDASYDYTGKKVALLGNGSTGIQILPAIQPDVKHLTTFIRSPTWITPGFAAEHTPTGDGANFKYSDEQRALWRKDPEAYFQYRKRMEEEFNLAYNFTNVDSDLQKERHVLVKQIMEEALKDMEPELRKKLIPEWALGCRRITYARPKAEPLPPLFPATIHSRLTIFHLADPVKDTWQDFRSQTSVSKRTKSPRSPKQGSKSPVGKSMNSI